MQAPSRPGVPRRRPRDHRTRAARSRTRQRGPRARKWCRIEISASETPEVLVPITTPTREAPTSAIAPRTGSSICCSAASAMALFRQSYRASDCGTAGSGASTAATIRFRPGTRSARTTRCDASPASKPAHTSSTPDPSAFTIPSAARLQGGRVGFMRRENLASPTWTRLGGSSARPETRGSAAVAEVATTTSRPPCVVRPLTRRSATPCRRGIRRESCRNGFASSATRSIRATGSGARAGIRSARTTASLVIPGSTSPSRIPA